jgi:hypothetical protein
MGERENLVTVAASVLDGLEIMESSAQAILDQIAEERAVLEGLLILTGGVSYRQKRGEKGVEIGRNEFKMGENGPIREGVAV